MSLPEKQLEQAVETDNYDIVEKSISLSNLPKALEYVLRAEIDDFVSESPRATAADIAERAGVHINSVFRAHKDVRYLQAKDRIQDIYFQGKADIFYSALVDSARSGKVGAIKLGLEITGKHVTRIESRNVNISAGMDTDGTLDLDKAIDRFIVMIGNRGWSLEMLADRWRVLKSTQAF